MAKETVKFDRMNIYVKNHHEAVKFYRGAGFKVLETSLGCNGVLTTQMKLDSGDFMISIIEDLVGYHKGLIELVVLEGSKKGEQYIFGIDIKKKKKSLIDMSWI